MSRTCKPRKKHENMDKLSSISMASRARNGMDLCSKRSIEVMDIFTLKNGTNITIMRKAETNPKKEKLCPQLCMLFHEINKRIHNPPGLPTPPPQPKKKRIRYSEMWINLFPLQSFFLKLLEAQSSGAGHHC